MLTSLTLGGIELIVYRDDLNHSILSGNKLHKLTPNIELAKARSCSSVLSYGGPYSNHLHALAWVCKEAGLASIGVVRGELQETLTPTLNDCKNWGMQLVASSRKSYRESQSILSKINEPCLASNSILSPTLKALGAFELESTLVIPEGGSNVLAIDSLSRAYSKVFELVKRQELNITHTVCATGTGATLTGLYQAAPDHVEVLGVQAVADGDATLSRIRNWLGCQNDEEQKQIEVNENSSTQLPRLHIKEGHLGRFAKVPAELVEFIKEFEMQHDILLDPVYTGKVMFKLSQLIKDGYFKSSDKILFIHTGGLQGKRM